MYVLAACSPGLVRVGVRGAGEASLRGHPEREPVRVRAAPHLARHRREPHSGGQGRERALEQAAAGHQ